MRSITTKVFDYLTVIKSITLRLSLQVYFKNQTIRKVNKNFHFHGVIS